MRKTLLIVLAVLLPASFVWANGQGDDSAADGGKTVVTLYRHAVENYFDELKQVVEEKYSDIELVNIPTFQGNNQQRNDKLTLMLMSNEDIDLFDCNQAEYFNFVNLGVLTPLNSYMAAAGFDPDVIGADLINASRLGGELYALPIQKSYWMVFYNKNVFDNAGIPYPKKGWTWDDFREVSKKLVSGEGTDKVWGYIEPTWPICWTGYATQAGGHFNDAEGRPTIDNKYFREALQLRYDMTMVDKSSPSWAERVSSNVHYVKAFCLGNVGMMPAGDWNFGTIARNLNDEYPFEYDIVEMPVPKGVEPGTTWGASRYMGINSKSSDKEKDAAYRVLQLFASSPECANLIAGNGDLPPVPTAESAEIFKKRLPPFVKNSAILSQPHRHVDEKAFHAKSAIINRVLKEESSLALTGEKSVDQAVKDMQKRLEEEL